MSIKAIPFAIIAAVFMQASIGCKDNNPGEPVGSPFAREDMLKEMAENVIMPSYSNLLSDVQQLVADFEMFKSSPNQQEFIAVRTSFIAAYVSWQSCSPFEVGPAAEESLRLMLNTFPLDTSQLKANLESGLYDLFSAQNSDAKGFPALDFLLFRNDSLEQFTQEEALLYFEENLALISEKLNTVISKWNDGYDQEFASNSGTSVGSSLGLMVNELNFDFELLKNAKVAIPLGLKTLGVAQPELVEAVYSGKSKELLLANLIGIKNLFIGAEGQGIDDYLDNLDAKYGNENLSQAIINRFDNCETKISALNSSLKSEIENNPSAVEALHTELQNLVVLLKTDMSSQLGVQITYQDNDGD